MRASSPQFRIFFEGKNITTEITQSLISVRYLDRMYNETDELQIVVHDADGLWSNEWYPEKGSKLKLQMGYEDLLIDCGTFEIDEVQYTGTPSVMTIKSLATWVTSGMRTVRSFASDGLSIKDIAQRIADEHSLKIVGDIFNVRIARSTQYRETDLAYLNRLGQEYGFAFSVRGTQLIFTSVYDQENYNKNRPVYEIDQTDMLSFSFRDTTSRIYKTAKVGYDDPKTGEYVLTESDYITNFKKMAAELNYPPEVTADIIRQFQKSTIDVTTVFSKTEDQHQAQLKAQSILHNSNTKQQMGNIRITGYPLLVAGNNIEVTGVGKMSGVYHIVSSEHTIDWSQGYITTVEVKRIGFLDKARNKPKKAKLKTKNYVVINETTVGGQNVVTIPK